MRSDLPPLNPEDFIHRKWFKKTGGGFINLLPLNKTNPHGNRTCRDRISRANNQ
jgi:hypothetical protein